MQELGWGQAVLAQLFPLGVLLPLGALIDPELGCEALAIAVEVALLNPQT